MQNANGSLSRMCRLARNVLFTLGEVIVLLQVYVMDAASYMVLLEHLFDTITKRRFVNNKEGNQIACITCSNTRTKVAILIYRKEKLPRKVESLANFW